MGGTPSLQQQVSHMPCCLFAQSLPLSRSVEASMYKAVSDPHINTQRMSLTSTSLRTSEEADSVQSRVTQPRNKPAKSRLCARCRQILPFSLPGPEPDLQGFRGTPVCAVQFQPFHVPWRKDANSTERMHILSLTPHPGLRLHPRCMRHRLGVRQEDPFQAPEQKLSLASHI